MTSVNDLREAFLSYFEANGHVRKSSAPLVPEDDPTLLFVNAGMVPFKNIFTGTQSASSPRATTSQKCVRAGGKHNDLDNVGYTARHHTFFEMLGNFSFGDYFKEEAIKYGWDFVTKELGLPAEKLVATVYAEDEEAAMLWKKISSLPDSRIIPIGTSDNFWSMGDTGPCGPCSEIFFDHGESVAGGPPGSPDEDGDRFIEIWNLVFMQFEQAADGTRTSLPKPSIDTGMGLERVAAVLQGKHNNYETDLFLALIAAEEEVYKTKAEGDQLASFRVIADHLRASSFLIADGVTPSNEGRGYVLRRIMRRAMRHGHMLGARDPSMHRLAPALVSEMGSAYPQLGRAQKVIEATFEQEEERFQRTLGRGLKLLDTALEDLGEAKSLPGETAFKLYDTYGFPLDLTQDILRGKGLEVDQAGFDAAMAQQKINSGAGGFSSGDKSTDKIWFDLAERLGPTEFTGYTAAEGKHPVSAIVQDGAEVAALSSGEAELLFAATPFYAESGGQAGDHGEIKFENGARFIVRDVQKRAGQLHAHMGELVSGEIAPGDAAKLEIDEVRRKRVVSNHSATHLMHAALRNVLGEHVSQKGSLVEADRLRFDFSHSGPMEDAELEAVEALVNEIIRRNAASDIRHMELEAAVASGALAMFGEKYDDEVRVLSIGGSPAPDERPYSVELCGGTHVERTGDIAVFAIMSEGGISAGVRRIEATTGADALEFLKARGQVALDLSSELKVPLKDVVRRVGALRDERKALEKELGDAKRQLAMGGGGGSSEAEDIGGVKLIARVLDGVGGKELRTMVEEVRAQIGSGVAAFVATNEGKATVTIGVTDDLMERFSAVDLVRVANEAIGGKGGGGKPFLAQAGGPAGGDLEAALQAVRDALAG